MQAQQDAMQAQMAAQRDAFQTAMTTLNATRTTPVNLADAEEFKGIVNPRLLEKVPVFSGVNTDFPD